MQAVNSSHQKQAGRLGTGLFPFTRSLLLVAVVSAMSPHQVLGADATTQAPDQLILLENEPAAERSPEDLAATIARLEAELMLSEERLDRAQLEYRELTQRLTMLDEQMVLLRNVIEVEHERLAQLQADLAVQNEAAARAALERGNGLSNLFSSDNAGFLIGAGALVALVIGLLLAANARRRRAVAEAEVYTLPPVAAEDAQIPEREVVSDLAAEPKLEPLPEVPVVPAPTVQTQAAADLDIDPSALRFDDTMLFEDEEEEVEPEVNKIDLATAYMAMGDREGAQALLDDVLANGTPEQQEEARRLKVRWWASSYSS